MQNEVVEEKAKKPLSKKGKLVRILVIVLAALVFLGGCFAGWFFYKAMHPPFDEGNFYAGDDYLLNQPDDLMNTDILLQNVYVADGKLHYTIENGTDFDICCDLAAVTRLTIYKEQDEKWVRVYPVPVPGEVIVTKGGARWNSSNPDVLAQQSLDRSFPLPEESLGSGHYRMVLHEYLLLKNGEFEQTIQMVADYDIPAAS